MINEGAGKKHRHKWVFQREMLKATYRKTKCGGKVVSHCSISSRALYKCDCGETKIGSPPVC